MVGGQRCAYLRAADDLDRASHLDVQPWRRERLEARLVNEDDERRGAAVEDGHLGPVDLHQRIVDAEPVQGGEQVLDRADDTPSG